MLSRVAAIQMTSSHEIPHNLLMAKNLIQEAVEDGAKLIVLPENFAIMGLDEMAKVNFREQLGQGLIQEFLCEQAILHGIWIVGGTIPIAVPNNHEKIYAACLVYNDEGHCVTHYDKIHLFDAVLHTSQETYHESKTIAAGNKVVVVETPYGKLGLAICYDVRFPEMFRAMHNQGVEIIALPSAFTYTTGLVHWEVLIRARAIENQVYIIAAAQTGTHTSGRKTYGHSMIVNPWGEVKSVLSDDSIGAVVADVDLTYLHKLRGDFPVLQHRIFK